MRVQCFLAVHIFRIYAYYIRDAHIMMIINTPQKFNPRFTIYGFSGEAVMSSDLIEVTPLTDKQYHKNAETSL